MSEMPVVPDPLDMAGDVPAGLQGQARNSWLKSRERRAKAQKFGRDMQALARLVIAAHLRRPADPADIETVARFAGLDIRDYQLERAERVHQVNQNTLTYDGDMHALLLAKQREEQQRHMAAARGRVRGMGLVAPGPGQQVSDSDDLCEPDPL